MLVERGRWFVGKIFFGMMLVFLVFVGVTFAQDAEESSEGPPLPLHTIGGSGGLVLTETAYLVNPGPKSEVVGKPSVTDLYANTSFKAS